MFTCIFVLRVYVCLNLAFSVALYTVPTLTLTCHNFKNLLHWNYSTPNLKPEFILKIKPYQGEETSVHTNQTSLEISKYTEDAEDVYFVQVEAKAQGSETVVSNGISFSYNENFYTDVKCLMDFPELNVSVIQHSVKLSFRHPYHVYKCDALKKEFMFTVYNKETERDFTCCDDDDMCTAEFQLSESLYGNCMNIQINGSVDGIQTKHNRKVCGHNPSDEKDWAVIITVLLSSGFGLMFLIVFGVMMYKKLTRPDSQNMLSKLMGIENSNHVNVPEQASVSVVTSVGQTPLLQTTNETLSDTSIPGFEETTHLPIQITFDGQLPDEQDNGEDMEEEDYRDFGSSTGYDSQKFPIDMGQGDMVEAYGPR